MRRLSAFANPAKRRVSKKSATKLTNRRRKPARRPAVWKMKTLRWMMLVSIVGLNLTGCATVNSGNFCDIARPIWFDDAGQLEQTPMPIKRQILDHNDKVGALCK